MSVRRKESSFLWIFLIFWNQFRINTEECYTDHEILNLALGKSTYASTGAENAPKIVDGYRIANVYTYCFVSDSETQPWALVDLGEVTHISTVVACFSGDNYALNQQGFSILIGGIFNQATFSPGQTQSYDQCGATYSGFSNGEIVHIHCYRTLLGRYVVATLDGTGILVICEMEVYPDQVFQPMEWICTLPGATGPLGTWNVAQGKTTYTSSGSNTQRTVDGLDYPYWNSVQCASTSTEVSPWWVVDLGQVYKVKGVLIVNVADSFSNMLKEFKIYVGNNNGPSTPFNSSVYEVCAKVCDEQINRGRIYTCHNKPEGRHVAIAHYSTASTILYLCEVEVYPDMIDEPAFESRESALTMAPAKQWMLYDNDETTCIDIRDLLQGNAPHISLKMNWYPNEQNTQAVSAMYKCKEEFSVNVTHGDNIDVSVYRGDELIDKSNVDGKMVKYSPCLELGKTEKGQFLHTRFHCTCAANCHILLRFALVNVNEETNSTVCTVKMYY